MDWKTDHGPIPIPVLSEWLTDCRLSFHNEADSLSPPL